MIASVQILIEQILLLINMYIFDPWQLKFWSKYQVQIPEPSPQSTVQVLYCPTHRCFYSGVQEIHVQHIHLTKLLPIYELHTLIMISWQYILCYYSNTYPCELSQLLELLPIYSPIHTLPQNRVKRVVDHKWINCSLFLRQCNQTCMSLHQQVILLLSCHVYCFS